MERKALNEPKSLGQELFTMTETSKTKRNIVRETITIQSGKSKLIMKFEKNLSILF